MQDPNQADRQEILSGPGDARIDASNKPRRNRSTKDHKKATILAASALVALIAAGGAGYVLANANGEVAPQSGARPQTSQSAADDLQGDDEATMGDADTGEPAGDGAKDKAADAPSGDDGVGDVADPNVGGDPSGDRNTSENVTASRGDSGDKSTNGKKPASSPTKAPQSAGNGSDSDNPADGPAGLVPGQCAADGC